MFGEGVRQSSAHWSPLPPLRATHQVLSGQKYIIQAESDSAHSLIAQYTSTPHHLPSHWLFSGNLHSTIQQSETPPMSSGGTTREPTDRQISGTLTIFVPGTEYSTQSRLAVHWAHCKPILRLHATCTMSTELNLPCTATADFGNAATFRRATALTEQYVSEHIGQPTPWMWASEYGEALCITRTGDRALRND